MVARTLLVDGDIVIYKAAFAAEEVHSFGDDQWASSANLPAAQQHVDGIISALRDEVKADAIIVCISDDANWRKSLYPNYKAPRGKVRRPILLKPLKEYVRNGYKSYVRDTLEADDVLGILATHPTLIPGMKIIATIDKDLLQIPGRHIHIDTRVKRVVSEGAGDVQHLLQALTGDVTDNYPGCPGIGKKKASDIIEKFCHETKHDSVFDAAGAWSAIVAAYVKKGLTEDDALLQARVARICRASDYDFATKSVRLWTPTSSGV